MKKISGKNDKIASTGKLYMLKLVPTRVANKQAVEVTPSWYESEWQHAYEIWNDWDGTKQAKMTYFHTVVTRVRVENQIAWTS